MSARHLISHGARVVGSLTRGSQCSTLRTAPHHMSSSVQTLNRKYTQDSKLSSSPVWKIGRLNHVAIAVPDIENAAALYRDVLGAKVSDIVALPEHGVYTVFVELDNTKIELLLPYGDKSPIQSYLDKNKSGGLHHVCLEVNDIEAAIVDVRSKGIRTLTETSRIGAHGKPVIFLHPKDCNGVLTELEQV